MTESSIQEQLKKLIELQKIDSEIYSIKQQLREKPAMIDELQKSFEEKKTHLNELEEKLKTTQVARKEKELDLKTKEEEIAKANAQLSQIKTNKEYTAKITEIESIKADKSIVEEKILLSFDEADAIGSEIDKEKENVAEHEKVFLSKKKEVEEDVKVLKDRQKVLESQRNQITPEVDPNFLRKYDRILEHKDGLAIAPVRGNTCGGCFMNLIPQMVNALKMHNELIECEICSRILYIEDEE